MQFIFMHESGCKLSCTKHTELKSIYIAKVKDETKSA